MIPVVIRTNIGSFKRAKWPTHLFGVPNVGDKIEAMEPITIRVKPPGESARTVTIERPTLEVVEVRHIPEQKSRAPHIEVELHSKYAFDLGWLYSG